MIYRYIYISFIYLSYRLNNIKDYVNRSLQTNIEYVFKNLYREFEIEILKNFRE